MWFFKRKEEEAKSLTVIEESERFILIRAENYLFLKLMDIESIEYKYNSELVQIDRIAKPPHFVPTLDLLMRKKV